MNTHSDVSDRPPAPSNNSPGFKANAFVREGLLQRAAPVLLRWALAVTFLSAVADRFGLWGPPGTAELFGFRRRSRRTCAHVWPAIPTFKSTLTRA